jgi:uncharacterized protein involved in type VI secretion and phage assembly
MINGVVVGIVTDNKDPDKMHRVKVQYPVDSGEKVESSWCRMMSPMAGAFRGLVMLPDVGTEVVLMFHGRTLAPYVLGGVYNGGADKPEPYKNDDDKNDKRVFWSRSSHLVVFDDTDGKEKVDFGAKAPSRLDARSGVIWHSLDSSKKTVETTSTGKIIIEAKETVSIKCKDFKLETDTTIAAEAKQSAVLKSGASTKFESSGQQTYKAGVVKVNPGSPAPTPKPAKPIPAHKHKPTK